MIQGPDEAFLDWLAGASDEEVNAHFRELGVTDEQIAEIDQWAADLVAEMAESWKGVASDLASLRALHPCRPGR